MELLKKSKFFIIVTIVAVTTLIFLDLALAPTHTEQTQKILTVNGKTITVEIAATPNEQAQGLSNRQNLKPGGGMLFVYTTPQPVEFWMKDMQFPLDIIWIKDNRVIGVLENLPAAQIDPLPIYASPGPIGSVLEINAGSAQMYNIKPGDLVTLENE